MLKCDIVVVGGGASGMMAAITAARRGCRNVVLLESRPRVGKKLLTTGNGRCNIANAEPDISKFHSNSISAVESVLNRFGLDETEDFFKSLGVVFTREGNKLYPRSLQAASVLDTLRFECERLKINIVCDSKVISVSRAGTVKTANETYNASSVIIACGGKAAPSTGSDGSGYELLKSLGHRIIEPRPAIVPLCTELAPIKPLKGVRCDCTLTLKCGTDSVICSDEVLLAEYGISGPAAMQLARFASVDHRSESVTAVIDFLPDIEFNELFGYLTERSRLAYGGTAENLTLGLLNKRVGLAVIKHCGYNVNDNCSDFTAAQINKICRAIKEFSVKVTGTCGFDFAQTTAGGAALDEFNGRLQSKFADRIFACGEVLDCDGDCGGFNLQWAWSSGYVAGINACERVNEC